MVFADNLALLVEADDALCTRAEYALDRIRVLNVPGSGCCCMISDIVDLSKRWY